MSSLRAELLGKAQGIPPFRLLLPAGWVAHQTSRDSEEALSAQARRRLMEMHQPAAYATLAAQSEAAFENARAQGAFMMISPGEHTPEELFAPVSILVSVIEGSADVSLNTRIADAVENRGARPLGNSRLFLRWVHGRPARIAAEGIAARTIFYITPVPGTGRSKALQFAASIAHPIDLDPENDPRIIAWTALLDSHIATFSWATP